jgi:precorrin-3B C17-methyltransferase
MGKLLLAGIGPGAAEHMTAACREALESADIIAGYTGYIDMIKPLYPDKSFLDTPMTGEVERCRRALELAQGDRRVCVVSSGDSGVYGMASLILELAAEYPGAEVEAVSGITAASSGGALLGAPLGHDFAVISLSDLLTPWETIEKRLRAAAQGDFAICLYNPGSANRRGHLKTACGVLLETLPRDRICGLARNIGRAGEEAELTTLGALENTGTDLFTTVFIGSSRTRAIDGKMVTPRGYRNG